MTEEKTHVGSIRSDLGNTIPVDEEGRVYHYGCKAGEVSNEILITPDYALAEEIAGLFDDQSKVFKRVSNRGYLTFTGEFKGKRLSVVAFGIGFAMIDFFIREVRAITTGPLTIIELSTAPTPKDIPLGTSVIIKDACAYEIDFENFTADNPCPYRFFKKPVPSNSTVFAGIEAGLKVSNIPYVCGRVASNPSFSAGVCAPTKQSGGIGTFDFKTDGLMDKVNEELGDIASLEMDTYPLYWTALRSTNKDIAVGAVSIAGSNLKGDVMPYEEVHKRLLLNASVLLEQLGYLQAALHRCPPFRHREAHRASKTCLHPIGR